MSGEPERGTPSSRAFDVLIVGGRVAGASLAIRLGRAGKRVLLVDRATFPSTPTVPSCPIVHTGAMELLDELGVAETAYVDPSAKFDRVVLGFDGKFMSEARLPETTGRRYVAGVNRATFDNAIWERVGAFPSVQRRTGFTFEDVVKDARGRVIGISGSDADGSQRVLHARWVVGADGRYSAVARKVGAKVTEDFDKLATAYYAEWVGLSPPSPSIHSSTRCMQVLTNGRGTNLLFFPMPEGRTAIATHQRADHADIGGDAEAYYARTIDGFTFARARLRTAKRLTGLVGIKKIANRYMDAGGPGWLLAGDAVHMKDPVDGQGIYDALLETKILAELLLESWPKSVEDDALPARWTERLRGATHAFYLATLDRLKRELYGTPPPVMVNTALRWLMTDPVYHERYFQFATRAIPPAELQFGKLLAGAIARGLVRDLRGDKGLPPPV